MQQMLGQRGPVAIRCPHWIGIKDSRMSNNKAEVQRVANTADG